MFRKLVLVGFLGMMPVMANATVFGDSHDTNTTSQATGGSVVGSGNSNSSSGVVGSGNSANSNRNDNSAISLSGADARSQASQKQGQAQGQAQGINAFNGNTTTVEAPDLKGAANEFATKHAETAGDARSLSNPEVSPCGDSTGLSGQVGVAGGGLATVTETCRAYRLEVLTKVSPDAMSTKLARFTHFVGWLPRTLLHVASFGVLN